MWHDTDDDDDDDSDVSSSLGTLQMTFRTGGEEKKNTTTSSSYTRNAQVVVVAHKDGLNRCFFQPTTVGTPTCAVCYAIVKCVLAEIRPYQQQQQQQKHAMTSKRTYLLLLETSDELDHVFSLSNAESSLIFRSLRRYSVQGYSVASSTPSL